MAQRFLRNVKKNIFDEMVAISFLISFKGGHYFFQGRSESGKIFLCNDKTIKENQFFEEQNAYLLLYKRTA